MSVKLELRTGSLDPTANEPSDGEPTNSSASASSPHQGTSIWFCGLALLVVATLLRVACGWNDLWFDEIISIDLASQMSGWHGILSEFRYDNNHYLNTAWVYLLGANLEPIWYRIPAICAGVAVIPVGYWVLKPYGRYSQVVGAVLFAFSHMQIHYSSEARGYAFQILFAVAAFGFIDRYHRSNKVSQAIGFGICASLALLSHLLTINFLLACGFWSLSFQTRQRIPLKDQIFRIAICLGLPLITGLFLYATNVKDLQFGGGPKHNTLLVATSAWSLVLGIVTPGWVRVFSGVAAMLVTAIALKLHWQRESELEIQSEPSSQSWKFLLLFLFLIPFLRILIPGSLLYTRYFLLQIAFSLMLLSIAAGYLLEATSVRRKSQLKSWFGVAFGLIVLLNLFSCVRLANHGRGSYRASLQAITSQSDNQPTTIALTNQILSEPVINYYQADPTLKDRAIEIVEAKDQPDWIVVHQTMDSAAWPQEIPSSRDNHGTNYQLRFISKASYLSGFQWSCYQRQP